MKKEKNYIKLSIPNDWRVGQLLFNFMEWLAVEKKLDTNQSNRMADTFHLSDTDFADYYQEFFNKIK